MIQDYFPTPYYAVIFTSVLGDDTQGYEEMAEKIEALAKTQEGFLGLDSCRDKIGVTISYWKDMAAIENWKNNIDHMQAKSLGKQKWYKEFKLRIAKVESELS